MSKNPFLPAPQDRTEPTPLATEARELVSAARLLAKSLPDEVVESIREPWGSTNVAVIKHWRDEALRLFEVAAPARAHQEEKGDSTLRALVKKWREEQPPGVLSELGLRAERAMQVCANELEAVLARRETTEQEKNDADVQLPDVRRTVERGQVRELRLERTAEEVVQRLTAWLWNGGLFNPGLMAGANEEATRQLILDARTALQETRMNEPHVEPCDVCEMGLGTHPWTSKQGKPLNVICNACLDNEVRYDPRGIRDPHPAAAPDAGDQQDGAGTIAAIRQRWQKRREPPIGTCAKCGHKQEMVPHWQPIATVTAEAQWRCQECGGQIQVHAFLSTTPGEWPDDDIATLLELLTALPAHQERTRP